jgi:L-serine dehydratase
MTVSVFDLFSIGIGPSSSHTVGPMRAARMFVQGLLDEGLLDRTSRVAVELYGSLGATGRGHGSDGATVFGLMGERPENIDTATMPGRLAAVRRDHRLTLLGGHEIAFDPEADLVLHRRRSLPEHPNGMLFTAYDSGTTEVRQRTYFSVGGGFINAPHLPAPALDGSVPYPFRTGADLLELCARTGMSVSDIALRNELARRSEDEVRHGLLDIWRVMVESVRNGCSKEGHLPGRLHVPRRARLLQEALTADEPSSDPLQIMDWVTLYALAVNEENASGGRIVTAPTNGAAGIIPAVLLYYSRFVPRADDDGVVRFLLTAGAIGSIVKQTASISGAEVGCQGEIGSACAMAAAGLTEVLGGTPTQVENAAEIGIEHHLGLTCDPVGGLVQIPCIERNAVGATKAIHAARLALHGDGSHIVTLDKALKTMRETGMDMKTKYKETSRGGLAVNVIEC